MHAQWFGLFRVRSPLLAESLLFSVPAGTEMVHFPALPSTAYVFSGGSFGISQRGFPHSEIPGSKPICGSPGLIAAYRVLHRLLVPRHSPYTLSSLTIRNSRTYADRVSGFRLLASAKTFPFVPEPGAQRPEPNLREFYAHCVCVVGKNYRLQDIQLSKNERDCRFQNSDFRFQIDCRLKRRTNLQSAL